MLHTTATWVLCKCSWSVLFLVFHLFIVGIVVYVFFFLSRKQFPHTGVTSCRHSSGELLSVFFLKTLFWETSLGNRSSIPCFWKKIEAWSENDTSALFSITWLTQCKSAQVFLDMFLVWQKEDDLFLFYMNRALMRIPLSMRLSQKRKVD